MTVVTIVWTVTALCSGSHAAAEEKVHVHVQARRREMVRQERMEQEAKEEELDVEYEVSTSLLMTGIELAPRMLAHENVAGSLSI